MVKYHKLSWRSLEMNCSNKTLPHTRLPVRMEDAVLQEWMTLWYESPDKKLRGRQKRSNAGDSDETAGASASTSKRKRSNSPAPGDGGARRKLIEAKPLVNEAVQYVLQSALNKYYQNEVAGNKADLKREAGLKREREDWQEREAQTMRGEAWLARQMVHQATRESLDREDVAEWERMDEEDRRDRAQFQKTVMCNEFWVQFT